MRITQQKNCSPALRKVLKSFDDLCFREGNLERHAIRKKVVSKATQKARRQCMQKMIRDLHSIGFLLEDIRHLKQKHIHALARCWEKNGLGPSQIQKMCSVLRVVCQWMGKVGVVPEYSEMFSDARFYRRQYVATRDRSWDANGVDPLQIFDRLAIADEYVAVQFLLVMAFGLRSQEAQRFHPIEGDLGDRIDVRWGTKNGKPRIVPFVAEYAEFQRHVLDISKRFINSQTGSTIPAEYTALQWYNHFYYVLTQRGGVSKKSVGVTLHGLRHQFLCQMYESGCGFERPLRRLFELSPAQIKLDKAIRQMIAEAAGHMRPSISSAYIGS